MRLGAGAWRGCWVLLGLLAFSCAGPAAPPAPPAATPTPVKRPRAVVLVTIDTLRADALGFMGNPRPTSPFMDRLAAEGIVLERAYAPSSFTPISMASLMTGLWPRSHGVTWGALQDAESEARQPRLPTSRPVLAERFQAAGWRTVGVPANRHLMGHLGFGRGFDAYWAEAPFVSAERLNLQAAALLKGAIGPQWATAWRERPLFLWLHYVDPHAPWEPWVPWLTVIAPEDGLGEGGGKAAAEAQALVDQGGNWLPTLGEAARALYDGEVRRVDESLERLFGLMGLDDDVLVVITSDHGEELGDHGGVGHANTLYEEVIRVPMLVRWPAALPRGTRVSQPVSLLDVAPTILELAGLSPLEDAGGVSLVPTLRGEAAPAPRDLYFELHAPQPEWAGLRRGSMKFLLRDRGDSPAELYDLDADPWETVNLAPTFPDRVGALQRDWEVWVSALPPPPLGEIGGTLDPAALEELRAMGYLQ